MRDRCYDPPIIEKFSHNLLMETAYETTAPAFKATTGPVAEATMPSATISYAYVLLNLFMIINLLPFFLIIMFSV